MKRFYLLSLIALVSAFAPAFLSAKTIILKQIAVTPLEGDTMFFNIDEYEKATFELTQTSPASRYLMLRRNDGAAVRIYLDEVKGITYKETTQTIDDPIEAPKVGDYYYSDGTWSDGGLISINADGTSPVWAEEKPAPVEGKTVIGIVAMTQAVWLSPTSTPDTPTDTLSAPSLSTTRATRALRPTKCLHR